MLDKYKYWNDGLQEAGIGEICTLSANQGSLRRIIVDDPEQNLVRMTGLPPAIIPITGAEEKVAIIQDLVEKINTLMDQVLIKWPGELGEVLTMLRALHNTDMADWLEQRVADWSIELNMEEHDGKKDGKQDRGNTGKSGGDPEGVGGLWDGMLQNQDSDGGCAE